MSQDTDPVDFSLSLSPKSYRHLNLELRGDEAKISLNIKPEANLRGDTPLKLNSYDLGVDRELANCLNFLRFSHPEIRVLLITSDHPSIFSAGANIYMLKKSSHKFKINFCKYTNETRLYIEEASKYSSLKTLCALNGTAAGGGYELAMACDRIILLDDKNATVSLPEVPLLGVLPGTGGLTRLVDKRQVRRDRADVFATSTSGLKGQKAKDWGLVDEIYSKSQWSDAVNKELKQLKSTITPTSKQELSNKEALRGIDLPPIVPVLKPQGLDYRYVSVELGSNRVAKIVMRGPKEPEPTNISSMLERGADLWLLRAFRELDDAILRLRLFYTEHGLWQIETRDPVHILAAEAVLYESLKPDSHWFGRELALHINRVLRRLDVSSRSIWCLVDQNSAYIGVLAELLLIGDRSYALAAANSLSTNAASPNAASICLSAMNTQILTTWSEQPRLASRFYGHPEELAKLIARIDNQGISLEESFELGLLTFLLDKIDFDDEIRVAIEERCSLSPDALSAMEANLRVVGPETMASKIFGRLSAWQNWVFIRENATGPRGALTSYGEEQRALFSWDRA